MWYKDMLYFSFEVDIDALTDRSCHPVDDLKDQPSKAAYCMGQSACKAS
jgi:hypothetical protein